MKRLPRVLNFSLCMCVAYCCVNSQETQAGEKGSESRLNRTPGFSACSGTDLAECVVKPVSEIVRKSPTLRLVEPPQSKPEWVDTNEKKLLDEPDTSTAADRTLASGAR